MGWELTIYGDAEKPPRPLGTREQVCAHFAARLPGLRLAPVPQAFADHMRAKLKELGLVYHPALEGCYETPDIVVEFSCTNAEIISAISANVRGNGDPLPALRRLCAGTSWTLVEDASGRDVLATLGAGTAWGRFNQWRDRSISALIKPEKSNA